jgi:hypothetical protein
VPDTPSMKTIGRGRGVEAVVIRRNLRSGGESRGVGAEKQEGFRQIRCRGSASKTAVAA